MWLVNRTPKPEICVNVTTMIKCLLPGTTTADAPAAVMGSKFIRSASILLPILIALSPGTAALTIARRSASGNWSRRAGRFFMRRRDNFTRKVEPGNT